MKEHPMYFPQQKLPTSKKTKEWYSKCLDSAEALALYRDEGLAEKHRKMQVWEDLYYDKIDEEEIERVFNPMQISEAAFPASIKNYPLSVPKIDLLKGEEIKRKFDWSLVARNEESYTNFSESIKEDILNILISQITEGAYDEQEIESRIKDISKFYQYSYKDLNEISATRVLQYLWREQLLKEKFSEGFQDALVKSQEIYRVDNIGGEPSAVRINPSNVFSIRRGSSNKLEDSDIIVEIGYEPVGKVIDEFHDDLTQQEVLDLELGQTRTKGGGSGVLNHTSDVPRLFTSTQLGGDSDTSQEVAVTSQHNLPYDSEGNVRIIRARWRGRRKIGRLTYFDPLTGDEQTRLVSEQYKPNTIEGESVKWFWVNEAYEATKIGEEIYVKMQPREVQVRHFDNPSKCFLGYVGTDYDMSLMARMEPYQYLYNVYMRRLELAIAKYKGPIYELDMSKKPDEWEVDQWMYYAEILGWAVIDPFNEGKKGAAQGKMAGNFNTTGKVLDADVGNYIQQLIMMLQYLEHQMGQIAGVSEQRQGQIDNRETVGGVERAVTQSSHITEKWFYIHDQTKKRTMEALLDIAKATWKKGSKKIGFLMEDMSRVMVELSEDFASSEYDLFVSNSSEDQEIRQIIKELSHAAVQNGASLSLPIQVLRSDSITEMAKKIESEEATQKDREERLSQQQSEAQERISQAQLEDKQKDRDLQYYEADLDSATKLQIAGVNNSEDNSIDQEKLDLQEEKQDEEHKLKKDQLEETKRHNKATEKISKTKTSK